MEIDLLPRIMNAKKYLLSKVNIYENLQESTGMHMAYLFLNVIIMERVIQELIIILCIHIPTMKYIH